MHILQLLPSLEVGGVERGVLDLAKGLIARGHHVSVVSNGGSLVERLTALGVVHHRLPVHAKSLTTAWSCVSALTQLITTTGVEVVHARSRVPAWIGWAAARRAQRPFVTTAHGFYRPHPASRVMTWGRYVIAPSDALGRYLQEFFHVPRQRLVVIPRGVDAQEFAFQPPPTEHHGPWRIGLFGRLSAIKGHAVALQACQRLVQQGYAITLCIAGDTDDETPVRRSLEALIRALKLEGAVEWLGLRHDMPAVLASVDLVAVPSVYPESFGRVVVEAQAVGRPVVASRLGALAELITEGETGLLVRPADPFALTEALERFITEGALRARCVEQGRAHVERQWTVDRMVEDTLRVYEDCLTRPRIVIWKLSALGDVILASPSVRAIRRQHPQGHLTWIVGRAAYEAVARCPYIDDILIYDPARKDRGLRRWLSFVRRVRRERFDLSIDLQNSRQTHLLAWAAGIPVRIGYQRKYGRLLNRPVRIPRVVLAPVAHQQYLLRQVGWSPDGEALEMWPAAQDEDAAQRLLPQPKADTRRPVVAIHPGASARWDTKRWDLDRWGKLCDLLAQHDYQIIVVGGPEEDALGEALLHVTTAKPHVLIGRTTILELACLLKRCTLFIGHDSSLLHVAAAVGIPSIALFGPTDPARHLPSTFRGQVIKRDVFCSPCYAPRCRTITHACMKRIRVEDVFSAVLDILAEQEESAGHRPSAHIHPTTL